MKTKINQIDGLDDELLDKVSKLGDTMGGALKFNRLDPTLRMYKELLHKSSDGTGTLKITMPKGFSSTMLYGRIMGFGYTQQPWTLDFSGYNYADTTVWLSTYAKLNGNANFSKVRFAYDGSKCCLLLGDLTTVWSYLNLSLTDLITSFQGVDGWETGWSATIIQNETGLTNIVNVLTQKALAGFTGTTTILTGAWSATGGYSDYPAHTTVSDSYIVATDKVDVVFPANYLLVANNAGVDAVEAVSGGFKLYAKKVPTSTLILEYTVLKGVL